MEKLFLVISFSLVAFLSSCQESNEQPAQPKTQEQDLIQQNREFLQQERKRIDAFIKSNEFDMTRTGSGLYYMVISQPESANEPMFTEGDEIEYDFRISLLDGSPVANSKELGARTIRVGKDQVEIGLHEAFALMQLGGKYLFIFPSHLAHGISSNEDNVPPRSTLIYEIEPVKKLN